MKKNLTITDSSSLIYKVCYLNRESDDFSLYKQDIDNWIESILSDTNADEYLNFYDIYSFRRNIVQDYKANRSTEKPKFFNDLLNYTIEVWNNKAHKLLESDDLVLINHNTYNSLYNVTICGIDGDLKQQSGKFYNPVTKEVTEVTLEQSEYNLWHNILKGGHNGLGGLRGCGDKSAEHYLSLVEGYTNYKYAVLNAYIEGIDKDLHVDIKKSVKGFGIVKGIHEFNRNFTSEYILRNKVDVEARGISFNNTQDISIIQLPIKYNKPIF